MLLTILLFVTYTTSRTVRRVMRPLKAPQELRAYVRRYQVMGSIGSLIALGLFWLLGYNSGSIDLDRSANRVMMRSRMTLFFPSQTLTLPLSDVDEAILDYKPNSARIRLITHSNRDLSYPMWSSREGQEEAVRTINQFLHANAP